MRMSNAVLSVTDLIQHIKLTLDENVLLKSFYVKGEISNFTAHHNGHWYFSLKDERARIQCVMFQSYARQVVFKPKEGTKVLLRASIGVYPVQGQLQCSVFSMESDGIGDLYLQFEQLKKKLYDEGYFEASHKQVLPTYPQNFGVITGKNTAALQDILETFRLRWPFAQVYVYSSLVQGDQAPKDLIHKLGQADRNGHDVLILARGGGSIEDLWAFNNEGLARAIYHLKTPLITGIGHETDTTIADMVADYRAPTPTGAVQAAVKDHRELKLRLMQLKRQHIELMYKKLRQHQHQLDLVKQHRILSEPETILMPHQLSLSMMQREIFRHSSIIEQQRQRWMQAYQSLVQLKSDIFEPLRLQLNQSQIVMKQNIKHLMDVKTQKLSSQIALLDAYSPLAILRRGYSIVSSNQQLIHSIQDVNLDQVVDIQLYDGQLQAQVIKKGSQNDTEEKL
jgi:exodeoxyribonuclease VII large subunit